MLMLNTSLLSLHLYTVEMLLKNKILFIRMKEHLSTCNLTTFHNATVNKRQIQDSCLIKCHALSSVIFFNIKVCFLSHPVSQNKCFIKRIWRQLGKVLVDVASCVFRAPILSHSQSKFAALR